MNALGKRRLLKLAKLIERRRRYDQSKFAHTCGTPACAWGIYVFNTPRLMKKVRAMMRGSGIGADEAIGDSVNVFRVFHAFHNSLCVSEFDINYFEADEIFGVDGCGNAGKSAKKAAAYIRDFVARDGK